MNEEKREAQKSHNGFLIDVKPFQCYQVTVTSDAGKLVAIRNDFLDLETALEYGIGAADNPNPGDVEAG